MAHFPADESKNTFRKKGSPYGFRAESQLTFPECFMRAFDNQLAVQDAKRRYSFIKGP